VREISTREKVKEIFFLLLRQMMWREIRIPNSNIYPQGSPNEMHIGIHRHISVVYLNLEKEI